MNAKHAEINLFLQNAYRIKEHNPEKFNTKDVYMMILSYDLDLDEFNEAYDSNYFSYFIEFYKNNKNINITNDPENNNNLLVTNILDHSNFINLYLNVANEKYFTVISKLIGFLVEHPEIKHYTKISKYSRSDQILLGFLKKDDLLKVCDYIKSNEQISNSLRMPNPFLFRKDYFGFSFDFKLDFNYVISYLVYKYLENKHDVNEVKADDFVYFVRKFYNEIINIESFKAYEDFINSELFFNKSSEDTNKLLSNYLYIFEEFFRLYDEENLDLCFNLYEYSNLDKESSERYNYLLLKNNLFKAKEIFDSYIKFAYVKYHDPDEISKRLSDYTKEKISNPDHASRYITREHEFRDKFKEISTEQIYRITNNDVYKYVDELIKLNDYD